MVNCWKEIKWDILFPSNLDPLLWAKQQLVAQPKKCATCIFMKPFQPHQINWERIDYASLIEYDRAVSCVSIFLENKIVFTFNCQNHQINSPLVHSRIASLSFCRRWVWVWLVWSNCSFCQLPYWWFLCQMIPVAANDVALSIHCNLISAMATTQILIYEVRESLSLIALFLLERMSVY